MSSLSLIPVTRRRRAARLLLPLSLTLMVVGLLPVFAGAPLWLALLGVLALVVAVLLLGVAVGLHRSVTLDELERQEAEFDAALMAAAPCDQACGDGCSDSTCAVKSLPRLAH